MIEFIVKVDSEGKATIQVKGTREYIPTIILCPNDSLTVNIPTYEVE